MTDLRRDRLAQRLRLVNRDFDECLRCAGRFASALLPLLQGGDSYAKQFRELRLRKFHGNARPGDDGLTHRALAIAALTRQTRPTSPRFICPSDSRNSAARSRLASRLRTAASVNFGMVESERRVHGSTNSPRTGWSARTVATHSTAQRNENTERYDRSG